MENGSTLSVGMDVHAKQIQVAMVTGDGEEMLRKQVGGDAKSIRKLVVELQRLQGEHEVECVYEAGPTGYALQRQLEKAGVPCMVTAPSLIPRKPGERIKTDRRDARKLAQLLRGQQLTAVCPPTPEQESVRDLCRARGDAREDLMRARHRLSKMLLRRGIRYGEGSRWTLKHRQWLRSLEWEHEADRETFGSYLLAIEHEEERLRDLDTAVEKQSLQEPYATPVGLLRCFRGFDTVNAMTVVAELHDIARFRSPRQLMAYLGLVPSEASSGERRRQGAITKAGNVHIRRALINASHHYRHYPHVSKGLRIRRQGQPQEIIALADKAMHRLRRRYMHLALDRQLHANKAVTAVARELTGFVWAALISQPPLRHS